MRVAVDVLGTLEGVRRRQIIAMIRVLVKADHEVVVWSSEFSMAVNAAKKLTTILNELDSFPGQIEYRSKHAKFETAPEEVFDYAIEDDRRQTYLAANKFIWVDEIPDSLIACEALVRTLK